MVRVRHAWSLALVTLAGCASSSEAAPPAQPPPVDELHITRAAQRGSGPCGWIYAFQRRPGQRDACVYVWSPERWTLGLEVKPGHFGEQIAEGRIEDGLAVGFPTAVLRDATVVYAAGEVDARFGGDAIPSHR